MVRRTSDADRLRRSVTQAIRRAIECISKDLPAAAKHLDNAVKTGMFVSYEPEEEVPWEL